MNGLTLSFAQQPYDYGFSRAFNISVADSQGNYFQMPWVGGLNSVQFSDIDLNADGVHDLFIFDKSGDRVLTFINNGTPGTVDYQYDYIYQKCFPKMESWAQLKDYNCDGKEDIFTYTSAGIKVFKNVSGVKPAFQLATNMILSAMGMGTSNILVTNDDFPAIEDIDGDGDLDILVFFGLGNFIELHKNLSMELYGTCDSLVFERTDHCWGDFAESSSSNHIFLNVTCPWKCSEFVKATSRDDKQIEHVGSTMLALDLDGDTDKDLILGDVDFNNLTAIINGGTPDSAHMVAADSTFPSYNIPVSLTSFNVATYVDINNDAKKDLLVSPFYSNLIMPDGYESVWLYKNTGSASAPHFEFEQKDFLQQQMIDVGSGAYPVFFDANADGLTDLLISNYGYLDSSWMDNGYLNSRFRSKISYYQNTGSQSVPSFKLITRDYANLSSLNLVALFPAFGDIDGDHDLDMILGDSKGKLLYFENTAGIGNPAVFSLASADYQGIDVGDYAAPNLVDIDGDSLVDLVIGKRNGLISYYKNTGTPTNAVFTKITDSLGGVNVTDYNYSYTGYSTPCFYRDTSGYLKLFVGSESGNIFYYKNIEANLGGKFTAIDSILVYTDEDTITSYIKDGIRSSVAVADLNNDGFPDLITGNFSGGVTYYAGRTSEPYSFVDNEPPSGANIFTLFPNPASNRVSIAIEDQFRNLNFRFVITNLLGQTVTQKCASGSGKFDFDTHTFPEGIYILSAFCGNRILNAKKFVIIR
ncbi:MAG: T9SS type A sorting domain-containing protein [Bacteroidota bacterium]